MTENSIEEIEKVEITEEIAMAKFLDCDIDELRPGKYDHYGLRVFKFGAGEYAIGTDEEADKAVSEYIKSNVWIFNPDYIIDYTKLPHTVVDMIKEFQKTKCEDANEVILSLIEDIDQFIDDAVALDGRGCFLSSYDGEEIEQDEFFIYRIN